MPNGHADHSITDVEPTHHEHGAYWPPQPILRTRAAVGISDLLTLGEGHAPGKDVLAWLRNTVESADALDKFAQLARRSLFGDVKALTDARQWLKRQPVEPSDRTMHHGSNSLGAEPWMNPTGLLDVLVGTAFVLPAADRTNALHAIGQVVLDLARRVGVTMTILTNMTPELTGKKRFDAFLDRLHDFGRFDRLPVDLSDCVGELLNVLGRPNGALGRASQMRETEIDDNTKHIGSVAPNPVCTGALLTLTAKTGESFTQRPGVVVAFTPCGVAGTNITWSATNVSVTVPGGAKTGPVYFAKPDPTAGRTLADTAATELAGVLGNCPFFAGGAATSIMVGAMHGPLENARCFGPVGVGLAIQVIEAQEIILFRALAQNGLPITSQSLPGPNDPITLEWEVTAGTATTPDVRLFAGGNLLAQGLGLKAAFSVQKAQNTTTYTLEVTSSCGTTTRSLTVAVLRVLRFAPSDVSVAPGEPATLSLTIDPVSSTPTMIMLDTSPVHPNAPGWTTIPAGQSQVTLNYGGIQPGQPRDPALTVLAYAPQCSPATGRVWVEPPGGTHQVVADRMGSPGLAKIDVVGVHTALTPAGTALLFAYDESPAHYADVNTGKSAVWDPNTNQVRSIPMSRNLFCAGHAFLGDGRLLVAAGQSTAITAGGAFGSWLGFGGTGADHDLHVFGAGSWTRFQPGMPGARWYPTCVTLPDGRVLIVSGYAAHAHFTLNGDYEIFDGATNAIAKRSGFSALLVYNFEFDLYPFLQVLPGRSLFVHSHDTTWLLPLNSSNEPVIGSLGFTPYYNAVSPNSRTYPGQGACVMLPLDPSTPTKARILVIGGGGAPHGALSPATTASNTAEIFDFDSTLALDGQSQWRFTRDSAGNQTFLTNQRLMADAVLLPDGTVAIIGGAGGGKADDAGPPIMWIESFDPKTETFTTRTGITVPRLYHSTALLLPNGSIMMAGSTGGVWNQAISGGSDNEFRIELYHPPYLFRGPRPMLRPTSTSLMYGQSLSIEIPTGGKKIASAALIRHGTTTHTNNMGQRFVGLTITGKTDTGITITLPSDGSIAPPGPYMLFVVSNDANGAPVPSIGATVLLGP